MFNAKYIEKKVKTNITEPRKTQMHCKHEKRQYKWQDEIIHTHMYGGNKTNAKTLVLKLYCAVR